MIVDEAVKLAKEHIQHLFKDESIQHLGLEEVVFEDHQIWKITLGFSRGWDTITFERSRLERTYKVIRINDKSGKVISMLDRILPPDKV